MTPQQNVPERPPEGALIDQARKARKLSVRAAAKEVGISEGWWRQIVLGYQSLSGGGKGSVRGPADTVARMAAVVGVTPDQLEQAGRADAAEKLREGFEAVRTEDDFAPRDDNERKIMELTITKAEKRHFIAIYRASREMEKEEEQQRHAEESRRSERGA